MAAFIVNWHLLFLLTPGSSSYFGISILILPPFIITICFYCAIPACNNSLFHPLSGPSSGDGVGGVSHMLKRLDGMLGRIIDLPMPHVDIFAVVLAAPLLEKSLIIQCHSGQRGRTMPMTIWSRSVVLCCTHPHRLWHKIYLRACPYGQKSTVPMSKSNKVPTKFLQSSYNSVYKEFSIVSRAIIIFFICHSLGACCNFFFGFVSKNIFLDLLKSPVWTSAFTFCAVFKNKLLLLFLFSVLIPP